MTSIPDTIPTPREDVQAVEAALLTVESKIGADRLRAAVGQLELKFAARRASGDRSPIASWRRTGRAAAPAAGERSERQVATPVRSEPSDDQSAEILTLVHRVGLKGFGDANTGEAE